jgi:serine/threonine-protein kinase 24/25/MST4
MPKRPLQADHSLGNAGSAARAYRQQQQQQQQAITSEPATIDASTENMPPADQPVLKEPPTPAPTTTTTRDAIRGRRVYTRVLDPALADLHDSHASASAAKREAAARLAEALAHLNAVDPEGAHHFMTNIVSSIAADSKLSATYLGTAPDPRPANGGSGSASSSGASSSSGSNRKPGSPQHSPTKSAFRHSGGSAASSASTPHASRSSHRRRGTEISDASEKERLLRERAALEAKLPGRPARLGLEHCKQLTDVLYERWAGGLSARWAAT